MVAAGHAIHDAQRVAQRVRARIDQTRGSQRRAKMPHQRSVNPAALDEIQSRRDTQPAGEFDAEQNCFAKFLAAHRAAQARHGERRWYRRRAGVQGRVVMRVVEFKHVAEVTVAQCRRGGGHARPAQHPRVWPPAGIY